MIMDVDAPKLLRICEDVRHHGLTGLKLFVQSTVEICGVFRSYPQRLCILL